MLAATRAEKVARAREMRARGKTWQETAAELGVRESTVRGWVRRAERLPPQVFEDSTPAMFLAVDVLASGVLLTKVPAWLPGYAAPQQVLVPATLARATVFARDADPLTAVPVDVFPNADGSGVPLAQPLVPDADGHLPGFVGQPAPLDLYVTGAGMVARTLRIGFDDFLGGIPAVEKGVANGVGTLDSAGRQPMAQSPLPVVSDSRIGGALAVDTSGIDGQGQSLAYDAATGRFKRAQPTLIAFSGLVPISGAVMSLKEVNGLTNGTDNVEMSRAWIPVATDAHLFAPIWAGWMLREGTDLTGGELISEVPLVNAVSISCAVETLDGRLFQLTSNGATSWTIQPGGQAQCDPIDIDIHGSSGGFWLRTHVQVTLGGFSPANRNISTSVTGANIVRYSIANLASTYAAAVAAISTKPSLSWALNLANMATDLSGNSHTGTGHDGSGTLPIGTAVGPFPSDGATQFNGSNDTVVSSYTPFVNGQILSVAGIAQIVAGTAQTLFGGNNASTSSLQPEFRVDANGNVEWWPTRGSGAHGVWSITWPTTGWVRFAFYYNETTGVAELFINGTSQGTKTGLGAYDASVGPFMVGGVGGNGSAGQVPANPVNGVLGRFDVWPNYQITGTDVTNLNTRFVAASTDQTMATGALGTAGSTFSGSDQAMLPLLLVGTLGGGRKALVALRGDSITEGRGDSPDATQGWARRGCETNGLLSVKLAKGSERGQTLTVSSHTAKRLAVAAGASHCVDAYGVNDYRTPDTTAEYVAIHALLRAKQTNDRGMRTYATTLTPGSTSTDSWATTTNQTKHPQDEWRTEYNNWLRAGAPVAATTLMIASALTAGTLTVADTSNFPMVGILVIDGFPIFYTGKTGTTFTGCIPASTITFPTVTSNPFLPWPTPSSAASVPIGADVLAPAGWVTTVVGTGQTLPLSTITVASTVGFATSGTVIIGGQTVTYTGKTGTTFTGCSGGSGNIGNNGAQQQITIPAGVLHAGTAPHPHAGYLEVADKVESARDSGLWVVNGSANYATADGIHPTAASYTLMSAAITDGVTAGKFSL